LWTYVDPRGKWYFKAKSYYSFGSTLHKVLERFHDSGDTGVTTVGDALRVYEESWIDAGYSSPEEMQEAFGEGREIVQSAVEEALSRDVKVLAVEKMLRYDMGSFALVGRIDRLDEHEDGRIEIVDYKSGRRAVTSDDVESDLAMGIYQLLVRRNFPDRECFATIHALRAQSSASASLSVEDLEVLESDLKMLGEQILSTGVEDVIPRSKTLCEACDFLALCRKHPDYA
jgi:putative RecB family exonuclease